MQFARRQMIPGISVGGVWCLWWSLDNEVINNNTLQPLVIGATPVNPIHDGTGYLRYESSPGVWTSAITDAFRISSDHVTHSCVVSASLGVYCWAANSLTDTIHSTIPGRFKKMLRQ